MSWDGTETQPEYEGISIIVCRQELDSSPKTRLLYAIRSYEEIQIKLEEAGWRDKQGRTLRPHTLELINHIENGRLYRGWQATLEKKGSSSDYNPSLGFLSNYRRKGLVGALTWLVEGFPFQH